MSAAPEPYAPRHERTVSAYSKIWTGRDDAGRRGHCDDCLAFGHMVALPGLPCIEVGCLSAHLFIDSWLAARRV